MNAADVRAALRCGKASCPCAHDGGLAHCPAHKDLNPSLSLTEKDGRVLFNCFGGCSQDEVLAALRECGLWGAASSPVNARTPEHPPKLASGRCSTPTRTPPEHPARDGVTLAGLAGAKKLAVDFLQSFGVRDCKYDGRPAVRIPYRLETGEEAGVHFRVELKIEPRFRWRKGDKVALYGLDQLQAVQKAGWCLLVEGESDCWTAWGCGIPALGVPGKSVWQPAWAAYLSGVDVYVWQEPQAEDFSRRIAKSLPGCHIISAPDGIKDISEAHLQGKDIPALLEGLKSEALDGNAVLQAAKDERLARLQSEAGAVLQHEDPLKLVEEALKEHGYAGDVRPALVVYLAMTSRLLAMRPGAMPVHVLLLSPSSGGKSYTVESVRRLLPEEACWSIDAGSPRILIYSDEPVKHRVLIFGEADSLPAGEDNPAASAIRALLQEHRLCYEVTVRGDGGQYETVKVAKAGPSVLVTTACRPLGEQLMTRMFTLELPADREQIAANIRCQAALETRGGVAAASEPLQTFQSYLQARAPWDVVVPFAEHLAEAITRNPLAPRVQRDFARLLSLVKAVAVLRHAHRQIDADGRLVARIEDYATVLSLVGDMYQAAASDGASKRVRDVVAAVVRLDEKGEGVTTSRVASELGIAKSSGSVHVRMALRGGWLVNAEGRRGHPARLKVGEPLPAEPGLPSPDEITKVFGTVQVIPNSAPNSVLATKTGGCSGVRALTDGRATPDCLPQAEPDGNGRKPTALPGLPEGKNPSGAAEPPECK